MTAVPEVLTIGPAGADQAGGPAVAAAAARLGRRAVAIGAAAQHELDFAAIRGAGVLWVALGALAAEPGRSGTLAAMESRARRGLTILDVDPAPGAGLGSRHDPDRGPGLSLGARIAESGAGQADGEPAAGEPDDEAAGRVPVLFASGSELRRWAREGLDYATVAVGWLADCAAVTGENDPVLAGWALLGHGVRLAVIRHGAGQVLAMDSTHQIRAGPASPDRPVSPGRPAGTDCPDGAASPGGTAITAAVASANGAFGGALCHGLLAGWELGALARFAAGVSFPG